MIFVCQTPFKSHPAILSLWPLRDDVRLLALTRLKLALQVRFHEMERELKEKCSRSEVSVFGCLHRSFLAFKGMQESAVGAVL
jgi:hypothetical protein